MSRKVNIKCLYFRVLEYNENTMKDKVLYDLQKWFYAIKNFSYDEKTINLGDGAKGRLDRIKVDGDYYALNFVRMEEYSSTYIVSHDKEARHVDIAVDDNEYIGKNTVAVYNSQNSELMLMSHRGGFSAHTLTTYINSFFENPVCILEPIKKNIDFMNPHARFGKIQIKIKSVKNFIPSKGAVYENVLQVAENMDAETFSFEYSVGRKRNQYLDANVVRTIISDAFSNLGVISIAKVKMTDEVGTALYSLFENMKHIFLEFETDIRGEVSFEKIATDMIARFNE